MRHELRDISVVGAKGMRRNVAIEFQKGEELPREILEAWWCTSAHAGTTAPSHAASSASARVLVLRDGGRRGVSFIRWWTTDGTAHAGSDFARLEPRTERFSTGEQNRTLLVPIIGDRNVEGPENFFVDIAVGEGAEPTSVAQIEIIINDDD